MAAAATQQQLLAKAYYETGSEGALGGVERLYRAVRDKGISRARVRAFLAAQEAYTLHRPARRHYARRKTVVRGVDAQWQADLVDMADLARDNGGMRYILTVIDCFSRYAWAVPVRKKDGEAMRAAFETLFLQAGARRPRRLQTDQGREFYNPQVKSLLAARGIEHFSTYSDTKASLVERFNRTLKQRMWTHFTAQNTKHYLAALPGLVRGYNTSVHRALGMSPERASAKRLERELWHRQFGAYFDSGAPGTAAAGAAALEPTSQMRISRQKATFEKGYLPNWTREVFRVRASADRPGGRRVYKVEDALGEPVHGAFYPEEVQAIAPDSAAAAADSVYRIERIISKQQRGKPGERWFVKWLGWPSKFNSWIAPAEVQQQQQ